jgi:hypothetical protein
MFILPILKLGLFCVMMLDSAFGGQAWMVDVGWFWAGSGVLFGSVLPPGTGPGAK